MTKGAEHFLGVTTLSALASEPVQTSLWDEAIADPAHPARPDVPISSSSRPATARLDRRVRSRAVDRSADQHLAGHSRAGRGLPGDAHRDVGAPRRRRQHRHAAPRAACTSSSPTRAGWPVVIAARAGWPRRSGSSPTIERVLGGRRTGRECMSWSPPAAPASRSTPCGSSPTAAAASRATRSPPRRLRNGRPRHAGVHRRSAAACGR